MWHWVGGFVLWLLAFILLGAAVQAPRDRKVSRGARIFSCIFLLVLGLLAAYFALRIGLK